MTRECEVQGTTYVTQPMGDGCMGCAGYAVNDDERELCKKLGTCHGVVWIKKEGPPVPHTGGSQGVVGRKDDSGKLDVTLLFDDMPHALEAVTEVLQWAITKKQPVPYERGSWQGVEDFQRRYRGAQLRHELNRSKSKLAGKPAVDHETGLRELAHIATDALFRLEMACRAEKGLVVVDGGAD